MADETSTDAAQWDAAGGNVVASSTEADPEARAAGNVSQKALVSAAAETGTAVASSPTGGVGESMQGSSDNSQTIVVHSDSSIEYGCPQNGSWSHSEVLSGSLTGSTVDGAGCYAKFTFTGDSVTMYGATGPKAGVFGCSTSSEIWEAVGWWSAYGTTPFFAAYQGSCTISGLGFGKHTITMTNSPNDPKLMYFTGLRYSTNQSAITYAAPDWSACCAAYTFPENSVTTIESSSADSTSTSAGSSASSASSSGSSSSTADYDWKTVLSVALFALGIVALASLLVGAMCCKKRNKPSDDLLTEMASGKDPEKEPLRRKKSRSSHRRMPSSDEESTTTESSGSSDEDKKRR